MSNIIDYHAVVIDEYMANGLNGTEAVMKTRPGLDRDTAAALWGSIVKSQSGSAYLKRKREDIRASSSLRRDDLVQQLLYWLTSDATDYLDLTPKEFKALPKEARMCIESINHRKDKKVLKDGTEVTTEVVNVRLVSKTKAMDILNKVMGNYELDNMQKRNTIDISKASTEDLNAVLRLMQSQVDENDR